MGRRPAHTAPRSPPATPPARSTSASTAASPPTSAGSSPGARPITLLGETAEDVAEAQRELVRIGIDRPAAHATGGPDRLERPRAELVPRPAPSPTSPRCATTARSSSSTCAAPTSTTRPASPAPSTSRSTSCRDRLADVPAGEVWVHCAGGYRASVAASMLDAAGPLAGRGRRHLRQRRAGRAPPGGARRVTPRSSPLVAGALIGLSLGALGGGGSILAVPVLVYAARPDPGAGHHRVAGRRRGRPPWRAPSPPYRAGHVLLARGVAFGAVAIGGAVAGARAVRGRPRAGAAGARSRALMLVVAGVMAVRQLAQPAAGPRAGAARPTARRSTTRSSRSAPPSCASARGPSRCSSPPPSSACSPGSSAWAAASSSSPPWSSRSRSRWSYAAGTSLVVITITSGVALARPRRLRRHTRLVAGRRRSPSPPWSAGLAGARLAAQHRHPAALRRLHRPRPRRRRLHRDPGPPRPRLSDSARPRP